MVKIYSYSCLLFFFLIFQQSYSQSAGILSGTVYNEEAVPVQNASVKILNSPFFALTDKSGEFVFMNIPPGNYTLQVSKMGYADYNRLVEVNSEETDLNIILNPGPERLNEVTVTAQKREELLQDVPLSITSLSYEPIEESHIQTVNDLTAIAPNLYASDPGDRRSVTSIRGIVTTSYDPAIATYIDGVNQFNLDTYIPQLFDVERIEVLRGPQGTLYGRNAMGGVINIITKQPDAQSSFFGEATIGNYGRKRFLAGLRTPVSGNNLFFGAALLFEDRDGFYINEFNNSQYDEQKSISGNYFLKYIPSGHWSATLNFKHFSNRNEGAFPLVSGVEEAFENPFRVNQNQIAKMIDNTINSSLIIDYKGNSFNFSSLSAFQNNYRYYNDALDADFSPLDAISIFNNYGNDWNNVKVFSQEYKFSSPGGNENKLHWTTGTFLFYQESPVKQAVVFGEDAALLGLEDTNFSLISTTRTEGKGAAIFGQATYSLLENLRVTAGLRYDYEEKEQSVLGEYQRNSDPEPAFQFQQDTTAQANFIALSPKIGITFDFKEDNLGFITYSRGFRAGGLTPLSSNPAEPPLFRYAPEFSDNLEMGLKNTFNNNKLIFNATLFYSRVTDVQVPTLILPDAVTLIRNTGRLSSKGGELEIKAKAYKGLEVIYDLGITDATYEELEIAEEGEEVNLEGKQQIFTPEFTSMLALQYKKQLQKSNNFSLFVRGEWKAVGKQFFDLANTIEQSSYSLFNSHMGSTFKNWKLTIWGRNLFDKRYISYAYDFGAIHLGNPAPFGASLTYRK